MEVKHIEGYDCIYDNLRILLKDKNVDIRRIFNKLWYSSYILCIIVYNGIYSREH